jgi:hypothetical protein
MPSLPDGTPSTGPDSPAAVPPILDPDAFERHEGLRETTLAYFTTPEDNAALRRLGALLFGMALECIQFWPKEPGGIFFHQARAAVADLRHLQGYLAMLDQERRDAALTREEERVSAVCGRLFPRVQKVADALEKALNASREEE